MKQSTREHIDKVIERLLQTHKISEKHHSWSPQEPTERQKLFLGLRDEREALFGGAAGGGKASPINTLQPTPYGWVSLKDIKVGDEIFSETGEISKVTKVFDIIDRPNSFRIFFDDGSTQDCCENHQWLTFNAIELAALTRRNYRFRANRRNKRKPRDKRPQKLLSNGQPDMRGRASSPNLTALNLKQSEANIKPAPSGTARTTLEIYNSLRTSSGRANHAVPVAKPLILPNKEFLIDPYTLGLWLGDGSSAQGYIGMLRDDWDNIEVPYNPTGEYVPKDHAKPFVIKRFRDTLTVKLREEGLLNNKHIPQHYLRGSYEQRLSILQGLMDTDGTVCSSGSVEFTNTNRRLIDGVYELIVSLGWKAQVIEGRSRYNGKDCGPKWDIKWTPSEHVFRLPRKRCKQKLGTRRTLKFRYIVDCQSIEPVPMRCIQVDSPSHLYLTGKSMIPTHNSSCLLMAALEFCDIPGYSALLLRRSYADLSKSGALMHRAHEWLTGKAKWNETKKTWTFPSGATLAFGYLENENDKYIYQGCFGPDHEILTKDGWKRIEDAKVGELVASLNPATREVEYKPVIKTHSYPYSGRMVNAHSSNGVSFSVTPNHNVWWSSQSRGKGTNFHLKKTQADNLPKTARIPQWGTWAGTPAPKTIEFVKVHKSQGYIFNWADFAEFLGWYLSEGYLTDKYGGIGLVQLNKSGVRQISTLLTRMGIKWTYNGKVFRFACISLAKYLRERTGNSCYNKTIPRELLSYRPNDLKPLLYSLVEGDGTWYKRGRNGSNGVLKTTSEKLANTVSELAIICGYRPTIALEKSRPDNNKFGPGVPVWRVNLCNKGQADTTIGKLTESLNSHGKVYCVTVPPYHTILIRYRGRVSWSGQSEYQFVGFDELTQFSESQYLYLFSRLRRLHGSSIPIRMRSSSNPGGYGAKWVYERFIPEGFTPANAQEHKVWWKDSTDSYGEPVRRPFVPAKLIDNPHLDYGEYVESLKELDPVTREQLLKGDWRIHERGDIFPMWSEDHHVISWSQFEKVYRQRSIPNHWSRGIFADAGTTEGHPNVTSWFAAAPENARLSGSVFLYRGHCVYNQTVREIAEHIKKVSASEINQIVVWRNSHEANSERISYNRDFNLPFSAWKADRNRGIAQIANYLEIRHKTIPHPFKPGVMGRPTLYLVVDDDQLENPKDDAGLARWRAEIPVYHYKTSQGGIATVVQPHPLFNDACDTLRAAGAEYFAPVIPLTTDEKVRAEMESLSGRTFDDILLLPAEYRGPAIDAWRLREAEIRKKQQNQVVSSPIVRWRRRH